MIPSARYQLVIQIPIGMKSGYVTRDEAINDTDEYDAVCDEVVSLELDGVWKTRDSLHFYIRREVRWRHKWIK